MNLLETDLPGVLIFEPRVFTDDRGFFMESYHEERFQAAGIPGRFVQHNHSRSCRSTLRGLHYQLRNPQGKLCRVVQGEVWDVAVDLRRGSPTFGRWTAVTLSAENRRQIYIPRGFAHGFLVLSETADFLYQCDAYYAPGDEHGIAWHDPDLRIEWPLTVLSVPPLLSPKDRDLPRLAEVDTAALPVFADSGNRINRMNGIRLGPTPIE